MKIQLALIVAVLAAPCLAQSYLSKPLRLLVSFSAGSGSDTIGRIYAGGLGEALSQQVIVELGNWYGVMAPAKTPREIIDRVRSASVTALANPGINKRLQDTGFVPIGNSPEEFGAYLRSEIEAWCKIVRELKLSAD